MSNRPILPLNKSLLTKVFRKWIWLVQISDQKTFFNSKIVFWSIFIFKVYSIKFYVCFNHTIRFIDVRINKSNFSQIFCWTILQSAISYLNIQLLVWAGYYFPGKQGFNFLSRNTNTPCLRCLSHKRIIVWSLLTLLVFHKSNVNINVQTFQKFAINLIKQWKG